MKVKRKIETIILILLIILCSIGIIYSLYNIIIWKKDVDNNNIIIKEIKEKVVIDEKNNSYKIDFKSLKEKNPDVYAYLKVKGTNIDYVVVKGNDNSYYLKHNFNKEYNVAGWIFADYHNSLDQVDKNIVIYGHNTKDGSMFGTLKNTLDKSWQMNKDNLDIILITENNVYKYQVFSTYTISPEDYYINTIFNDEKEYSKFLNTIKERSNYNYNIKLNPTDKILTLSSCTSDSKNRVVLHAKLIKEDD